MLAVMSTDGHEKVQLYMKLLPGVTWTLSPCFSASVYMIQLVSVRDVLLNPFNASCSKLPLFDGFVAILV